MNDASLEAHLRVAMPTDGETPQTIEDGGLAIRLVALARTEPDIRTVWLECYDRLDADLLPVVGRRGNRSPQDFEVRLCAATIVAAIRVVDETVCAAAIGVERRFTPADLAGIMAGAIRDAATLPICDAVSHDGFGARSARPDARREAPSRQHGDAHACVTVAPRRWRARSPRLHNRLPKQAAGATQAIVRVSRASDGSNAGRPSAETSVFEGRDITVGEIARRIAARTDRVVGAVGA